MVFAACLVAFPLGVDDRSPDVLLDPNLPHYELIQGLTGTLHSVGSNRLDAMTFTWIRLFRKSYPGLTITMEARGNFTAAPALTSGYADIAPTVFTFSDNEVATFEQKYGYKPLFIRVSGGSYNKTEGTQAFAVFVHRDNPLKQLTLTQLDAIFSSTHRRGAKNDITTWGQLGLDGKWADMPITLYSVRKVEASASAFQDLVMLHGTFKPTLRERAASGTLDIDNLDAVVAAVANDPSAIGYAGFAQSTNEVKSLSIAESEGSPFIAATFDTVLNRQYPLSRFNYIYVNKPPGKPLPPMVREFLRLILSAEGQRSIVEDGSFLPLPLSILKEELAKIE